MTDTAARPADATRFLFIAGALIALSHLANEWVALAAPWGLVWKASGIAILGLYALSCRAWAVGIGLVLSSVGDVLLEIYFQAGMAAFALAHISYIVAFAGVIRRDGLNKSGWLLAAAVLIISIALGVWLTPGMAELLVPGLIYQVIISVMVITAMLSKASPIARAGAVIFMLSDSLIAVEKFGDMHVIPGAVWITYAVAQIMLAWGFTRRA
jgi:uncharacterized membrane protein YhhN